MPISKLHPEFADFLINSPKAFSKVVAGTTNIKTELNWSKETKAIFDHNAQFKIQSIDSEKMLKEYFERNISHIFDDRSGHLPYSLENKNLFLEVASDTKKLFYKFRYVWKYMV